MGEGCGALYAPDAFEELLDVVLEEVGVDLLVLARHLLHEVHLHPVEHQRVLLRLWCSGGSASEQLDS
jgi:hypothetical protein